MNALIYQPDNKWRSVTALTAAAAIHLAAITFATTQREAPAIAWRFPGEPTEIFFEPQDPIPDPPTEQSDSLTTPPVKDDSFPENTAPLPLLRPRPTTFTPLTTPRNGHVPSSLNISAARVVALNAPGPEYPYEARRQKITGDGVAVMSVDPASGSVTSVTLAKSTGSAFLDNAAIAGFRRWRFKPGTVSTVKYPITFTLTGASY